MLTSNLIAMKNNFLRIVLAFATLSLVVSCEEDKTDIAPFSPLIFTQNFEGQPYGSGSTEIPINISGWGNYNLTGSRKWIGKSFDNSVFAEFSSFYSAAGTTDETWLITSKLDLTTTSNETFVFTTKTRFANGAQLKVLVSTNYAVTLAGVCTATWTELSATLPTADNVATSSGNIDLSSYESNNVYIAFKYMGSKAGGTTTTFQLDDIKLFENK